jgi:hypothetical protein
MLKRLKQAWKRDRLGVLGVCCTIVAVALVVFPADVRWETTRNVIVISASDPNLIGDTQQRTESGYSSRWFSTERLPAAGVFAFAGLTMLLLRRR